MCALNRSGSRVQERSRGSSLIETVVGLTVIIPILLVLVDCAAVVIAQTSNDALCKHAARAAAECATYADVGTTIGGNTAAKNVIQQYNSGNPSLTTNAQCTVTPLPDAATWQNVRVNTTLTAVLPVPVPFTNMTNFTFQAQSQEPVVSNFAQ
jgi:hypothetical protein